MSHKLFIICSGTSLGGSKQSFFDYCQLLSQDYNVYPIMRQGSDVAVAFFKQFPEMKNNVHLIDYPRVDFYPFNLLAIAQLKTLISELQPALIICHKPIDAFFIKKILLHVPVITVAHGFATSYIKSADRIIAVSQAVKDYLQKNQIMHSIDVCYNSVQLDSSENKILIDTKRSDSNTIVLGTMCVFRRKKNLILLLKVIYALRKHGLDVRLIIGGKGRMEGMIRIWRWYLGLQDVVQIIPWIEDKKAFFSNIDIYCISSLTETFNFTALEAMKAHVPVVSTPCKGPQEIIQDNATGYISPDFTPETFSSTILKVIKNRDKWPELTAKAYHRLEECFSHDSLKKSLHHIINQSIRSGSL